MSVDEIGDIVTDLVVGSRFNDEAVPGSLAQVNVAQGDTSTAGGQNGYRAWFMTNQPEASRTAYRCRLTDPDAANEGDLVFRRLMCSAGRRISGDRFLDLVVERRTHIGSG